MAQTRTRTSLKLLLVVAVCVGSADTLDMTMYERNLELQAGAMKMYWTISGDTLLLGLEATATGWVAFGLAETTGMRGSDIVYYEAARAKLIDAYAPDYRKPVADTCQDWNLEAAEQQGTTISLQLSRKLLSSDTMDRNITDDAAIPLLPTPVIAAWGNSEEIEYHCSTCRV